MSKRLDITKERLATAERTVGVEDEFLDNLCQLKAINRTLKKEVETLVTEAKKCNDLSTQGIDKADKSLTAIEDTNEAIVNMTEILTKILGELELQNGTEGTRS